MKTNFHLEWTDYLESQLLHIRPSGFARILAYGVWGMLGCSLVGSQFLDIGPALRIALLITACFFLLFIPLYRYVLLPRRVKKIFLQQKELSSPFEIEVTESSLNLASEYGNGIRPWINFTKWKESRDLLLLYHSDVMFTLLPKRFFSEPQQVETIKAFLNKNNVPEANSRSLIIGIALGCCTGFIVILLIALALYLKDGGLGL